MKAPLALLLMLLVVSCSRPPAQTIPRSIPLDPNKPHFTVAAGDLSSPAALGTNAGPNGQHATIVVRLSFNAPTSEAFQKFTREHTNEQIQFIVGSNVVAEPNIMMEIPHGKVEIAFSSRDDAERVRDSLNRK